MKRLDLLALVALLFIVWNFFREAPRGSSSTSTSEPSATNAESAMGSMDKELDAFTRDIENTMDGDRQVKGIEIPEEFIPQDFDRLGSIEKLEADLGYRREKFESYLNHEKAEFTKSHDVQGKDKAAYRTLWAQHDQARQDLRQRHREILTNYEKKIKEESSLQLR